MFQEIIEKDKLVPDFYFLNSRTVGLYYKMLVLKFIYLLVIIIIRTLVKNNKDIRNKESIFLIILLVL